MKQVRTREIKRQLNNCFEEFDPLWPTDVGRPEQMEKFKSYLIDTAGIDLNFEVDTNNRGEIGYKMISAYIVNESAFLIWMLKWS